MKKKLFLALALLPALFSLSGALIFAQGEAVSQPPQEETLEAVVEKIAEEKQIKPLGAENLQLYQKLELLVTKGSLKDKKIIVENGNLPVANSLRYKVGDKVMVSFSKDFEGNDSFYITDYVRRESLLWLFLIFALLAIAVARWRGAASILGMGISFLVIFVFILPKISAGANPVGIAILGALMIIPPPFSFPTALIKKP